MRRSHRLLAGAAVLTGAEAVFLARRRGRLLALNTVVRCHRGHLFTTYWIPGVSFKSFRLGPVRVQRCPVGGHWSLVWPAEVSKLGTAELDEAAAIHDLRVP
jgi:hypothetical protein